MATLYIDRSSIEGYKLFLAVKALPRYRFQGWIAHVPDEYMEVLGLPAVVEEKSPFVVPECMFDYQGDITSLACRKEKFAVFAAPGMGKSLIMFGFTSHAVSQLPSEKCFLIASPLMVINQTIAECKRFYGESLPLEYVSPADLQEWLIGGKGRVGITNFEAFRKGMKPGRLGGMAIDECFAPGTLVDCVDDFGDLLRKPIENVLPGDKIINASGVDVVAAVHRREVPHAIHVSVGEGVTCSPNHPFFTQRGWVSAGELRPGDSVSFSGTAVRMVRGEVQTEECIVGAWEVLREILLCEMADEPTGVQRQAAHPRGESQEGNRHQEMVGIGQSESTSRKGQDSRTQTNRQSRSQGKDITNAQGYGAWAEGAWRERHGSDGARNCDSESYGAWLDSQRGDFAGQEAGRLSDVLQVGRGEQGDEDRHRGGWILPRFAEGSGREEGCQTGFTRVDGIEVLQQGDPRLDRFRDVAGKLYFYDLEATRHPSFSVNGLLVHNSSTMKSSYGEYGRRMIQLGRGLRWKLCLTGTPAPNDRIEYANHAVFLDRFPNVNSFLAKYFVNRGQTDNRWEMKPHALRPFYRALSDWCIFLQDPATYGWKDNVGVIPPVRVHIHDVPLTREQKGIVHKAGGHKDGSPGGITKRGKLAQLAKGMHEGRRVPTNKPDFILGLLADKPGMSTIIWCRYNQEQEQLASLIPGCVSIDGGTKYRDRMIGLQRFQSGEAKVLISKPKVLGFGLNLQIAGQQIFNGLWDSYEEYFQAVKRSNRIGSTEPLDVHVPVTMIERAMVDTVLRKAHRVETDTAEQERIFKEVRYA